MKDPVEIFRHRLQQEWLPSFCNDEDRLFSTDGFKTDSIKISPFDAENFMRALDSGLVEDAGGGRYRCKKSNTAEQIFWEGLKSVSPRPLTLWLEPVITIATIARLGLDYEWPEEMLAMQSADWAFDFAIYRENDENEYIAGEVKKTEREVNTLIADLMEFSQVGNSVLDQLSPKKTNSFKKWEALLSRKAPLFWAVGPNDYTFLFSVKYQSDKTAVLSEMDLSDLNFSINRQPRV